MAQKSGAVKPSFVDQTTAEQACTYAALILHDDGLDVNGEQILKLVRKANVRVEPFWAKVYEKALKGRDINDLMLGGGQSSGPAQGAPVAAQEPAKKTVAEKPKEKEPEPAEDVDMGGLFDF